MKFSRRLKVGSYLVVSAALGVFLSVGRNLGAQGGPADKYERTVNNAAELLGKGQFEEGLRTANEAISDEPDRFEAYYLGGLAAYRLNKFDDAARLLEEAQRVAPNAKRELIGRITTAVSDKRKFLDLIQRASIDYNESRFSESGRQYEAAWRLFPMKDDVGLRAAVAYRSGNNVTECVRVLRELSNRAQDPKIADEARSTLKELLHDVDGAYLKKAGSSYAEVFGASGATSSGSNIAQSDEQRARERSRAYELQRRGGRFDESDGTRQSIRDARVQGDDDGADERTRAFNAQKAKAAHNPNQ